LALDRRGEDIAAERAELEAAVDPRPLPLPTRAPRDPQRPGAPFWLLVDFADELDEQARAGLEGALEADGLRAGATTVLDQHHAVLAQLGERFLIHRVAVDDAPEQGRSSLAH